MSTANIKHTWTLSIKNDSGAAVVADPPLVIIGDAEVNSSQVVDAGATVEVDVAVTVAKIISGFVSITGTAGQTATAYTNAVDGTGGQVFNLTVGKSVSWNNQLAGATNPFTANITKFYFNNSAGTKSVTFRAGFLLQAP